MMNPASPERVRQDCRLIGQTLLKLALPRLLIRAVVLIVAAIIWLLVASWLLDFGRGLSFDSLQALGQQTSDFLARINPYVWWGVVVIWTLIVFFIVRAWVTSDVASTRARPVPPSELAQLRSQLSDDVTAVLRWVWGSRDEPFTLGDLRLALAELRHSRIGKMELVRQQGDILDGHPPAQRAPEAAPTRPAMPPAGAAQPDIRPDVRPAGTRIEPNL
ncbi:MULTISPECIES: hypothetical protein [Bordetella]|uniref:Poly-beta-1,6-N-acetyl-D-glucosamine biosynthesis protein PgaD n=2 Tax=Bordetella TaxID=517 RepID=A0A261W9K0_9BORD|nr:MULTISPECIES: hypothetical protein [Bordetella]MDM9560873.1 hypothetical protein [Bordetella petrii]OZI82787.1 hypothetical protein CAL24_00455 [Bordetella genomosp. 2]